jgi:hypothetical protein
MKRNIAKTQDLLKGFRNLRNQVVEPEGKKSKKKQGRRSNKLTAYEKFLKKYVDLENTIDTFRPIDLLFFFREKAGEADVRYVISNQARDCGVFKLLLDRYDPEEICLMIEFLFLSEQDYLDKSRLQPTVLASRWCNTIYQDSLLWVDDKYVNRKKGYSKPEREFNANNKDTTQLGGWN